jgi:hypothetical protein
MPKCPFTECTTQTARSCPQFSLMKSHLTLTRQDLTLCMQVQFAPSCARRL